MLFSILDIMSNQIYTGDALKWNRECGMFSSTYSSELGVVLPISGRRREVLGTFRGVCTSSSQLKFRGISIFSTLLGAGIILAFSRLAYSV
jgi:hypothetical protein